MSRSCSQAPEGRCAESAPAHSERGPGQPTAGIAEPLGDMLPRSLGLVVTEGLDWVSRGRTRGLRHSGQNRCPCLSR